MGGDSKSRSRSKERSSRRDHRRRDRSRSRSRDRRRRRDRSRSRSSRRKRSSFTATGDGGNGADNISAATKLQQMMVQQQQQAQMFSQMMNVNAMSMGGKKQRELYVGNLAIGMVTEQMLRDFFNTALKGLVPEEAHTPAVMNVWMAADMKYSFVEMRTEHLATSAIALDKVELCGRSLNVGRPSGYVPSAGAMPGVAAPNPMAGAMAAMQAAMGTGGMHLPQAAAAAPNPAESKVVILENMLTEEDVAGDEYDDIVEDIKEECGKHGAVESVSIPRPGNPGVGKAFVKFTTIAAASKSMDALSGRTFDGRKVVVKYMPEADFAAGKFS